MSGHQLRFVGLDTSGGGGTSRPVLAPLSAFLARADPDAVALLRTAQDIAHRIESLSQAGSAPLWSELSAVDRATLTATLSRLSLRMDALRPIHLARTSPAEVELARRHLDIAMATVQEDVTPALTAGSYLHRTLGRQYRAIALTHTDRVAPAITMTTDDPHGFVVAEAPVAAPTPTSVEGALAASGLAHVTSALPPAPLRANNAAVPRSMGAQGGDIPCDVADAFDIVLTVPTATMSDHVSLY